MTRRHASVLAWSTACLSLALAGCAARDLDAELSAVGALVDAARANAGSACAPVSFATAETELGFARMELNAVDPFRAEAHLRGAREAAELALTESASCAARDRDRDGIPDAADACPDDPEDLDGDADLDGCPDLDPDGDADGDGIPNARDACITRPEDFDGHDDDDGCPEDSPDTDGDGVIDALDACPDDPEDVDGFEDDDGCSDPDNDGDGVPDLVDACPGSPEDFDFWEDGDGCPDQDNDGDGIHDLDDACPNLAGPIATQGCPADDADRDGVRDAFDQCPDAPETWNGIDDDDGCPDAVATTAAREGDRIILDGPIPFDGDDLGAAATAVLDAIAAVLSADPAARLRIVSHVDATGDTAGDRLRSDLRGQAVRAALVARQVEGERLTVVGQGGAEPVDTNRTAAGRARNRRIELFVAP